MSLINDALAAPRSPKHSNDSEEEIALVVAWLNGVVTDTQAARAVDSTPNNVAGKFARALRRAIANGRLPRIQFVK